MENLKQITKMNCRELILFLKNKDNSELSFEQSLNLKEQIFEIENKNYEISEIEFLPEILNLIKNLKKKIKIKIIDNQLS